MADSTRAAARDVTARFEPVGARLRAGITIAALGILAAAVLGWLWFLWGAAHAPVGQYDFSSYYAAAAALRADPHADIYSQVVMARYGAIDHVQVQPPLPYTYPPLLAILFMPLTLLPFRIAARLWLVGNATLWLACTLLIADVLRGPLRRMRPGMGQHPGSERDGLWSRMIADPSGVAALALAAALCLPFAPAQQTVLLGQIDLLVLLPLALVPWLARHGHFRWVGVAIAIAAMLKLTPVLLLAYVALRRRWEAVISGLVALAVLALVSLAVVGPGVLFAALPEALRVGSGDAVLGHNEALFASVVSLARSSAPGLAGAAHAAQYVILGTLALAVGWVLWRAPRPEAAAGVQVVDAADATDATDDAAYAVALCAMVLVSPAVWVHHFVWVLPAAGVVLGLTVAGVVRAPEAATRRAASLRCGLAVLACILLSLALPYNWDTEPHPAVSLLFGLPLRPVLLEARAVGALLILVLASILATQPALRAARSRGATQTVD